MDLQQGTLIAVITKPNGLSPEIVDLGQCLINSSADNQEVEILKGRGRDFKAMPDDVLFVSTVGGTSGNKVAVVTHAELTPDTNMLPGDSDIHANVGGAKVSQVKCGSDGLITIKNQIESLKNILLTFSTEGGPAKQFTSAATKLQIEALFKE